TNMHMFSLRGRTTIGLFMLLPAFYLCQGQSADTIQAELARLNAQKARLDYTRDTVLSSIEELEGQIEQLEFELAKGHFGPEGYTAVVTRDNCDMSMSGSNGMPGKGDKVLVVGVTHDGYWRIHFRGNEGKAGQNCIKIRENGV